MLTTVLIAAGTIAALVLSLITLCRVGQKDFYHRRRVRYVPHIWALITASGVYWALVSQDANVVFIFVFTCLSIPIAYLFANPAEEYMWAIGHHPNA